jgi:hypothetical protein
MSVTVKTVAVSSLEQLKDFLLCIEDQHYSACSALLLGASIGQHVRHVLEFYLCLKEGYVQNVVNYDLRKRDYTIEQSRTVAIACIEALTLWIDSAKDAAIRLEGGYGEGSQHTFSIPSNVDRELVYNIEHAIHHMAIIKIAGTSLYQYTFPTNFGVADSTINHQAQHVHS